jgi:hypothetical protein
MLDRLTPEQFDEWLAFWELEPDRLERIATILGLGFSALANTLGAKLDPTHFDPHLAKLESERRQGKKAEEVSPNQGARMMSMILGAPN